MTRTQKAATRLQETTEELNAHLDACEVCKSALRAFDFNLDGVGPAFCGEGMSLHETRLHAIKMAMFSLSPDSEDTKFLTDAFSAFFNHKGWDHGRSR